MSYSPYNAPLLAPILGDREVAAIFGIQAEISSMIRFEAALAKAQCRLGMISKSQAESIATFFERFSPDIEELSAGVAEDGMAVPGFVKQVRSLLDNETADAFHLHCTSQDVIDSCGMMKMRDASAVLNERLVQIVEKLEALSKQISGNGLMGYTRMQAALPILATDRVDSWASPLRELLQASERLNFPIQLGGPVGRADAYDGKAGELAELMSADLGLSMPERSWQNNRITIVEIGNWLSMVSGQLAKIGADICLMAQIGEDQIELSSGGGSSAMPHKKNPIPAEALVTIGKYNAGQISTLHNCLVHEQERSGSAWTLEWMVMPQLFVTTAAALRNALGLIGSIERIGKPL